VAVKQPQEDQNRPENFPDSEELLLLAQEAGGLGIFEWHVPAGTVRL
jgi:hypothetical protein